MDDVSLIAAARLGDEDAFAELYRRYARYVQAIGRSILHTRDVEDMCQETFLLAFSRLQDFEGGCQFGTWIRRIATNYCLVKLRTARQAMNGESNLTPIGDGRDGSFLARIDHNLEGVLVRLDLNNLLQLLQPVPRRILEMTYLEGMEALEIAEELGISLSSVKRKLDRARKQMLEINSNK